MPVEVPCPNCRTPLKAPDGMDGRKVRCKKCQTSFRLPGAVPGESLGDSVHLSVADSPASPPPAADANPFAFDTAPTVVASAPSAGTSPAARPEEAFAFPSPNDPTPVPADKSKSKYRPKEPSSKTKAPAAKADERRGSSPPEPKSGKRGLILGGVFGLLCAAGGAAAVVFLMPGKAPDLAAQKSPPPPTGKLAEPSQSQQAAVAPADGDKAKEEVAKEQKSAPPAGATAKTRRGPTVAVTGGQTPPPPLDGPGTVIEKPAFNVTLDIDPAKVRHVLLAGSDTGLAAVVWASTPAFQGKGARDTVELIGTLRGAKAGKVEIEADGLTWPRPADLSPDGTLFAAEGPAGKVTVWEIGSKAKRLDAVVPADGTGVAGVYFTAEGQVAVVSKSGATDIWDVAGTKAATGPAVPGLTAADVLTDARTVVVSPDRRAILLVAGGKVHAVSTKTGMAAGSFALPMGGTTGYAVAADLSGSRIAVAYQAQEPGPHTVVAVGRLDTDKPKLTVHLAADAGLPVSAEWVGAETVLVTTDKGPTALVIDAEVNKLTAAVRGSAATTVLIPTAGRLACVLPSADGKKTVLTAVEFPPDGYLPIRDGDKPTALAISAAGLGK